MNEFRAALEAYLGGRTDLDSLAGTLRSSLQRQPHLAAAHSAIIEAMFRSQRLTAPARDSLHKVVQSVGQAAPPVPPPAAPTPPSVESADKTHFRAPPPPTALSPPTPPSMDSADKTHFRAPPTPPTPPTPPAAESADKTQFRMPKPGPPRAPAAQTPPNPRPVPPAPPVPAPPVPAPISADKTQLRATPQTTGRSPPTPPAAASKPPAQAAPQATSQKRAPAAPAKGGSLSDLLGTSDAGEPQADPSAGAVPAAPPPATAAPRAVAASNTGTGSTTGTGQPTGTGPWLAGTGPSTGTGRRTGTGTGTSAGSASSGWTNLAGGANTAPLAPGDTIKDRFVLEDIIGKGGMGIVFRARDLRWEEAQDRNPYVAVKVLNEDFKRHPESLKALQRESRKAQNLAHPNVVTVYQFDRDGANVFMVMELLEGEPLDRFIKQSDATGYPPKIALKYTSHMARALAYAHEQGIVHSDFKPANAYITRDGTVKVFDFGISRAAKRSDKVSGSMTLFDPGTLGALTPAYASCEMIEGEEPDPRDDIYALACTFYELLTGKHPFGKQSAVQARDAKMTPAPVPGLSRAQWRGLQRGLSFSREQRSPSVMQFLNDVSPRRSSPVRWIAIGAAVVVVGVIVAVFMPGYLEKRRLQGIAQVFRGGNDQAVPEALERMGALTPAQRGTLLTDQTARDGLLSYFERQIDAATDESKQKYEYVKAFALLKQAQTIFTDSSRVEAKNKALEDRQNDLINRLSRRFDDALARGYLIDKQNSENASRVLAVLVQVQPNHPLLTDKRLVIAYVEQAGAALDRSNMELANALIAGGLKLAPQDPGLKDLNDRSLTAATGQQVAQRVSSLRADIDTTLGTSPSLDSFDRKRAELIELRSAAPEDSGLARWQNLLQSQLDRRLNELTNKRSFTDAETLLAKYAELASAAYVADRRDNLTEARKGFTERLARLSDSLQAAIIAGRLAPPAADNAKSIYLVLERSGADAEQLSAARDQIATAFVRQARELRSRGAFEDARKRVATGLEVGPGVAVAVILREESQEIDDAEKLARATADQRVRTQMAEQRTKEDNASKAQLATALRVPHQTIESARSALQLAEKLQNRNVSDPLVAGARREIQNQLLAEIRATSDKSGPDAAIRFAEQASALMPEATALSAQLVELRKASTNLQAQTRSAAISGIRTEIDTLLKTPKLDEKWWRDVNAQLRRLAAYLPDSDPYVITVKRNVSNSYIAAARKSRDAKSLSEAERLLERAAQLSPAHPDLANERKLVADARAQQDRVAQQTKAAADTDAFKQRLRDQAKADDIEFLVTLRQLKQTLPESDTFLRYDAPMLIAESYMRLATKAARRGSYEEAVTLLDRGLENASGLVNLRNMRDRFARLIALNEQILTGTEISVRDFRAGLDAIAKSDPTLHPDVQKRFKAAFDARVRTEKSRNPALAATFESAGAQLFGAEPRTTATRPAVTGNPPVATPPATNPPPTVTVVEPPPPATAQATPVAAGPAKPCRVEFQGSGRRAQAVCYDSFAAGRGPDIVIIPAGGTLNAPVGVMRYELTNEDYNFYCATTARCKSVSGGARLPIVAITVAEGERYAAWLSEASGKVYRLPTDAEWSYVATGVSDSGDFNCSMDVNGQKIKGFALAERNNGSPSKWGIYNMVGNAQEWARAPGGWVARGGAFSDNTSNCAVSVGRAHSGTPDGKTGIRLIREF